MTHEAEHYLTPAEEQTLLRLARFTLEQFVCRGRTPRVEEFDLTPATREKHGAFVTLRRHGALRGCIGYTANQVPLAEAVLENTINAASRDPRFPAVGPEEVPAITIEISALTPGDTPESPFRKIHDTREIVIGRDGLYIERPPYRGGILLPQVAVDQGWDVPEFLSAVCQKAGYPDGAWREEGVSLYRFSAQVFSEHHA